MASSSTTGEDRALVPGEERAVRAWLKRNRYEDGDLRSEGGNVYPQMSPLMHACYSGELLVCKWLHSHGAAEDITKANQVGETPMFEACHGGYLSICQWLFEMGAASDITKVNKHGITPMYRTCEAGHLSVCKWLFEVGAAADTTKAVAVLPFENGVTPMWVACARGRLPVCEWLFEVGAAADIAKADTDGDTPMRMACRNGHLSVCKWLVFNGALNLPAPMNARDRPPGIRRWAMANSWDDPYIGHIDRRIVEADIRSFKKGNFDRPALLAWAQDVDATHRTFLHVVLRASVLVPASHQQASPDRRCHLPRLPRVVLEQLGLMLDVEMGRRVRNVRELAELLWHQVQRDKRDEDEDEDEEGSGSESDEDEEEAGGY